MKEINCLTLCAFLFIALDGMAQNNSEKLADQVQQAANAVNAAKGLFKKKEKPNTAVAQQPAGATSAAPAPGNDNIKVAGLIDATTKSLDCDELMPFRHGVAIIKKGKTCALIDSAGKFVVPFGRYASIESKGNGFPGAPFFKVTPMDSYDVLYINPAGNVVFDEATLNRQGYSNAGFSDDLQYLVTTVSKTLQYILIDRNGKRTSISAANRVIPYIGEGIYIYGGKGGYGVNSISTNAAIFPPNFVSISPFFHGYAIYSKISEFGDEKYGILNKAGKIITPPIYSSRPDMLKNGMIRVSSAKGADFDWAYLNHTGKILYKRTQATAAQHDDFLYYQENYAISGQGKNFMMDTTGKVISQNDFFISIGLLAANTKGFTGLRLLENAHAEYYNDGLLRFTKTGSGVPIYGVCDPKGKTVLLGNFEDGLSLWFDPISTLSYAKINTGKKDNSGHIIFNEGYINREGKFVFLKGKSKSDF